MLSKPLSITLTTDKGVTNSIVIKYNFISVLLFDVKQKPMRDYVNPSDER